MSARRTSQTYDRLGVLTSVLGHRRAYTEYWDRLPQLQAAISAITSTNPTIAEMKLVMAVNEQWEVQGTNASADDVTKDAFGLKLETDTAANDQEGLVPHENTGQSPFRGIYSTDRQCAFGTRMRTGSAITSQILMAGLRLTFPATLTIADDADAAFFFYDTSDASYATTWTCVVRSGTDGNEQIDTGLVVDADRSYRMLIHCDEQRYVRFYIGVEEEEMRPFVSSKKLDAATTLNEPMVGIETLAAAAKHCYVGPITCAQDEV